MYSIESQVDGVWQPVGYYPDTLTTAERQARRYCIERGSARIVIHGTDEVVGTWRRVGDHYVEDPTGDRPAFFVAGHPRKVRT